MTSIICCKNLLWQMYDLKHCWKFCWNDQSNILLSFDLTSKCKDLTFFCKNCIVKYDLKHCWKIITPLCMSIARSLGKILFGFEHGKHDLFKASQGHHHFTQFWNLKFNYQKEKRVYLCYLFSYFVDVHILWLERVLRGWENFRYIRAAIETAEDFVGYLSDHAWKKDEKLSYVCKHMRQCWAKREHLSN